MAELRAGKIVTFYSFKGGVGRTMSLANIAFLAANKGRRVLVMDWDLEAPGLAYYFRGLLGPEKTDRLRKAPGVLNILWNWHRAMASVTGRPDLDDLVESYQSGTPFDDCTQPMLGGETFESSGEVHYVSAGSLSLDIPTETPYSEALAHFPWPEFFSKSVGGALIDAWRQWAKRNYDLVLVDSRTGLADVAGVCTMLFPDEVYLCFVLNRQNIEGTARVAGSIRAQRKGEVLLRAAPMRVAREGTPEEADARANALKHLVRVGKFTEADVKRDFAELAVVASQSVPFNETLAPFAADSIALDQLTFNYCAMASVILGETVDPPKISEAFRQRVRRRLAPRSAPIEYVAKLVSAEPARAIQELMNLIDSAELALHEDGDIPTQNYVNAIIETTFELNVEDLDVEFGALLDLLLQLLRKLDQTDVVSWRPVLMHSIERMLSHARFDIADPQNEVALLDELDHLLAGTDEPEALLERVGYRRRAAQALALLNENDRIVQLTDETFELLNAFEERKPEMSEDEREAIVSDRIDLHLIAGDALLILDQGDIAHEHFLAGVALAAEGDRMRRPDIRRSASIIHYRIATRFDPTLISRSEAARHALLALDANPALAANNLRLLQLGLAFTSLEVPAALARAFLERVYGPSPERSLVGRNAGFVPGLNTLRAPAPLIKVLTQLVVKASEDNLSRVIMTEIGLTVARLISHSRARLPATGSSAVEAEQVARELRNELALRGVDTQDLSTQLEEYRARRTADKASDADPA
jgi:hypothetical protein